MRIAAVIDNIDPLRLAGAETSTVLLAKALARLGNDVSIVTAGPSVSDSTIGSIAIRGVASGEVGPFADFALMRRPRVIQQVVATLTAMRPHVVQTHVIHNYVSLGVLPAIRQALPRVPLVATLHDHAALCKGGLRCKSDYLGTMTAPEQYRMPSIGRCWVCQKHTFNPLKRRVIASVLNGSCDRLVFVSEALRQFYRVNGVDGPSEVIYSGIDADSLLDAPPGTREEALIVCGGRMKTSKGYHVLIDSLPRLNQLLPIRPRLVVFGERNAYAEALIQRARNVGVGDQLELSGWLDPPGVRQLMARAAVGVVPSVGADALPRTLLEFMVCAVPVVASSIGGVNEVIENGSNGYRVPPGDNLALAEHIAMLLASPATARGLGLAGRSTALARFTVQANALRRIALYEELVREKSMQ